jgi:hypothetical protein
MLIGRRGEARSASRRYWPGVIMVARRCRPGWWRGTAQQQPAVAVAWADRPAELRAGELT